MKTFFTILSLLIITTTLRGQTNKKVSLCEMFPDTLTHKLICQMPDKIPVAKGGWEKLNEEFKKLKYPPNKTSIPKDAAVAFIIDANGKLFGKRIVENIEGTDVAKQILSLVDNVKWVPAICNNQNVPFLYTIPFRINGKQK